MSTMLSWAATRPVNPPGTPASAHLSAPALYASLLDKALAPTKYLPAIARCDVVSHDTATQVIVRDVTFAGAPAPTRERVSYTAPSVFVFDQLDAEGKTTGTVWNIVSEGPDGMDLTFAFRNAAGGPLGFDEDTPREVMEGMAAKAVQSTIDAARASIAGEH